MPPKQFRACEWGNLGFLTTKSSHTVPYRKREAFIENNHKKTKELALEFLNIVVVLER